MRKINRIIWHCSATPAGSDVSAATIRKWHTDPEPIGRGWLDIGYHFVIRLDGTVEEGRPVERAGAHTRGHNADSIGICYVGGGVQVYRDTRTPEQKQALYELTKRLLKEHPGATVHGHNEFDSGKACPSFDAAADWAAHLEREAADSEFQCPGCCICKGSRS